MIDSSLVFDFAYQNLDKVTKTITKTVVQNPRGLSTGIIALYASMIGAGAALLSQVIVFGLNDFKEKRNKKKELIAEERRLAFMLTELYKELVMHKVHKKYWYRTSEILNHDIDDSKDSHDRHFISNQRSFETLSQIRLTTSEYMKTVNHFLNITSENSVVLNTIKGLNKFQPRKASDFNEVSTYQELLNAQSVEEEALNEVYLFYSTSYDTIYQEMKKRIE